MMTPRLNKQHQWLPSCFDVNWQVFNLSNLMHDLNGGSSRMKTFPFQRLSTYSPPPHFFFTYCTFPHIFLIFFSDVFKRCPLVHLDWKILNQAWCRKCWKVKMICTQLLSIPAIFYMNQHCHSWQWQWQWLPISEEVKTNILFSCSCFALVLILIVVFRQRVLLLL